MTIETTEQTPCDACGQPCGRGWVESWRGNERVGVRCRGCDTAKRFGAFEATGHIDTWLMTEAAMQRFYMTESRTRRIPERPRTVHAICDAVAHVELEMKRFERDVWFNGLQAQVRASTTKGLRARETVASSAGPVTVLAYAMAGRAMVTLDAPTCDVTVITAEDESTPRMGLQGLHATETEARDLLRAVTDAWLRGEVQVVPDGKVGL